MLAGPPRPLSLRVLTPNGAVAASALLLDDLEQLDFEHERRARLDLRRRPAIAVRDLGRAHELRLAADLDLLDAFGPALDDAGKRERRRLAALDRAVEHGAVGQSAVIVDLHRVGGFRRRPGDGL